MKTLHLIRHAKSSWKHHGLSDQKRPLKKRGQKDAAIMAHALDEAGIKLVNINCSSAVRAQQTIQNLAEHWSGESLTWQVNHDLYEFSGSALKFWINKTFQYHNELTIVGHNPALTEVINSMSQTRLENFPTCAYAQIEFEGHELTCGLLKKFFKPKMFK